MAPGARFSEICETLEVSAHGCAMQTPVKLEAGVPLHFHSKEGRETTAQVVYCQPIGANQTSWKLGAKLDQPDNFWGLTNYPQDWAQLAGVSTTEKLAPKLVKNASASSPLSPQLKTALDKLEKQVSDEHLRAMIDRLVQPLQTELSDLKEKLTRGEPKRGRIEVSLSQIPPELEQQIELRLRKELGPRVLDEARSQSAQVLESAKTAIEERTAASHDEFLQKIAGVAQEVEQRAKGLSAEIAQNLRENLRGGLGDLQQQVVEAGNRLKRLSEELLAFQKQNLIEEHDLRRQELEQLHGAVTSESSRLQAQVENLDGRIATVAESAHRLESGLDERLAQLTTDTVSSARSQLESAMDEILREMAARSTRELTTQLDEACSNLKIVQKGIEASVSEALKAQMAEALQSFAHGMDELAQQSVGKWRVALAGGLNSLARSLGEQFRLEVASNGNGNQPVTG